MASQHQLAAMGLWQPNRASNLLDGGAHFYGVYECADGKHVSIGPLEPEFYRLLCTKIGVDAGQLPANWNGAGWANARETFEQIFKTKPQKAWCELLEGSDVCFAPVLNYEESAAHPHMMARQVYQDLDGIRQPSPAPRFSQTPGAIQGVAPTPGEDNTAVFDDWDVPEILRKAFAKID
jgi:alpha-methylacyl-CoA racemase